MPKTSVDTGASKPNCNSQTPSAPAKPFRLSVVIIALSVAVSAFALYCGFPLAGTPTIEAEYYAICSRHQKIYTVDQANSRVDCFVVNNSIIVATGSLADTQRLVNLAIRYVPENAIVVPGLSDSHGHLLEYGASRQLPLEGTATINDTVARVRKHILSTPALFNNPDAFVRGGGWDHTSWPGASWPTAEELDADPVVKKWPVILQSKDCHAQWVNARALELSGTLPESVEGGIILRYPNGRPTGVLLDNAQELLKTPPLTEDDLVQRFTVAVNDALAYGLTSVHDAGLDPASLDFFARQAAHGTIPIRIYGMRFFDENAPYWGNTSAPLIGAANGRLTARSVKIFADGALRTGGSALYEPYTDNPSTNGFLRLDSEVLFEFIPRFLRDGWQVNVHAIGDRANGIVLDAFEASLKGVNVTALRPRLEHAQLMTKEDMQRLGRLGVIASVQPTHAISDMWYAQDRLGPERVKGLYAFRSLIDSGARITLGSDFPVETMNPLAGFYAAITRVSLAGDSPHGPGGWFPEERLTREEALRGMTIDPAYASFTEATLGSIEVGKRADFVVLSRDIMEIPAPEILNVESAPSPKRLQAPTRISPSLAIASETNNTAFRRLLPSPVSLTTSPRLTR
ncbi:amidohydrolase family-domain-containing protein [Mycena metata]|uniref:Amidohydrolase family-domain-containing protein n=1 Tax=Mycena metata TaxID=1033252 RepID=A0AAD7K7G4_9AGAR|nr:amidohydrolase family-domain-containing protein [Mycena metata]